MRRSGSIAVHGVPAFDRVTVFGGITIDRIACTDAAPALGVSNPGRVRSSPGGVGFNIATSLARLGLKTRLVAIVGADAEGEAVLAAAKTAGVDVDRIVVSGGMPTATYQATIADDGELVIGVADMRVCGELSPAAVAPGFTDREAGDFWVLDANLMPETIAFLVGEAHASGRPLAGLAVSPAKATRFATLFDRLTYFFANRREAAAILGRAWDDDGPAPAELADEIRRGGCVNVVVTNAREPLAAVSGTDMRAFAPLKATVGTVNGAGDALSAGTVYGLSQGRSLFEAVPFGLALSALTVESDETVRSDLTPSLLAKRLDGGVR